MSEEAPLRSRILETSRHLLYEDGYKALSMRKIASRIDVSATSIYLHFENKDHLLHTLIEESIEQLGIFIESNSAKASGVIARLESIVNSYVEFALTQPEKYEVIYMVRSEAMAPYPKDKFRKARTCYDLLVKTIKEGVDNKLMDVADPVVAAYSIWAQLHGVVSVVLNKRLDSRINRQQFIEESIEHIVQGFLIRTTVS